MPTTPYILTTNDDGITSPGLLALKDALTEVGYVTVLAPNHNWSASGHVKTMHKPLRVDEVTLSDGTPALTTDGAPSDAVALACLLSPPHSILTSATTSATSMSHPSPPIRLAGCSSPGWGCASTVKPGRKGERKKGKGYASAKKTPHLRG
jgi:hypothetical protein